MTTPQLWRQVLCVVCGLAFVWFVAGCPLIGLGCGLTPFGFVVSGVLVSADTGRPIAAADLELEIEDEGGNVVYYGRTATGPEGTFTEDVVDAMDVCIGNPPTPELPTPAYLAVELLPNGERFRFPIDSAMVTDTPGSVIDQLALGVVRFPDPECLQVICEDGVCVGGECAQCSACTSDSDCGDDGQFCNGVECCDFVTSCCFSSGSPCELGETCDEANDACVGEIGQTLPFPLKLAFESNQGNVDTLTVSILETVEPWTSDWPYGPATGSIMCVVADADLDPRNDNTSSSDQVGASMIGCIDVESRPFENDASFSFSLVNTVLPFIRVSLIDDALPTFHQYCCTVTDLRVAPEAVP